MVVESESASKVVFGARCRGAGGGGGKCQGMVCERSVEEL